MSRAPGGGRTRRAAILIALACGAPGWPLAQTRSAATAAVAIRRVLASAAEQTRTTTGYDPRYVVIAYPNGDVPAATGVCTDVLIRAFRSAGVDLQKEVHEDMRANFAAYPTRWRASAPDRHIDHRRVPNLQTFFARRKASMPISPDAADYRPGDVVAWDLDGKGSTHIGLVSDHWNEATQRYSIVHNIGGGTKTEDRLFEWRVIGRYRYFR